MPGPSKATELATAGAIYALRRHQGDHTNAWLDYAIIAATGCDPTSAKNWRTGEVPPKLGSVMLMVEAWGVIFLADVFAEQDKDGALGERTNAAAGMAVLRQHLQDTLNAIDAIPAKPTSAETYRDIDAGGRIDGESR